jgi:hypothetical protein
MTTTDRPYFVPNLFQRRYWELLSLAEDANAAEVLVNASDWYVLTQCTPWASKRTGSTSIEIDGRQFTRKHPSTPPSGTLDLTGPEPSFEA